MLVFLLMGLLVRAILFKPGTGKTYTMIGTDESPGIMPLILVELFKRVEGEKLDVRVVMSYIEVG